MMQNIIIINPPNSFIKSTTFHKLKLQVTHYQIDDTALDDIYLKKEFYIWLSVKKKLYLTKNSQVMTLGQKIKELRECQGMLQKDLASRLGIGDTFLSKIETGQKLPKREYLKKLSEIFDIPLIEFETLWIASKINDIIENEEAGQFALKHISKSNE